MHISVQNLVKEYARKKLALNSVSLEIGNGMFGLLGPNGAGKTTLMKILATLLEPTSGSVRFDGLELGRHNQEIRRLLGYLPQSYGLYGNLTAYETLDYFATLSGMVKGPARRARIQELLEGVNLQAVANRRVNGFSGGMKQRLGIAQALLSNPDLLIVDEPTAGLDPAERIRFRNLLQHLSGERVVILSTHIVSDISSSCEDMAVIDAGQLLYRGRPDQLIESARGKVWQSTVEPRCVAEMENQFRVISAVRRSEGVVLRLLSEPEPVRSLPGVCSQDPTLEDAYLWMVSAEAQEGLA